MQAESYDDILQVLDSGVSGLSNDRFTLSPTLDIPFGRSPIIGSPGQCLISVSNYNFFNSADPKMLLPNSMNITNNISIRGAQQPMVNSLRNPGVNESSYPRHSGQTHSGKT